MKEIHNKMISIKKKLPFSNDLRKDISEEERLYWVWENLALEGISVEKAEIEAALLGKEKFGGNVSQGVMIWKIDQLREKIYSYDKDKYDFDLKMVKDLRGVLEKKETEYRKRTPLMKYIQYTPPLPQEVPEMMGNYKFFYHREDEENDLFLKAARLHNKFVAISPFVNGNLILARTVMEYFLVTSGYPMVRVCSDQTEYFDVIKEYLKRGNSNILAQMIKENMKKRLDEIEKKLR